MSSQSYAAERLRDVILTRRRGKQGHVEKSEAIRETTDALMKKIDGKAIKIDQMRKQTSAFTFQQLKAQQQPVGRSMHQASLISTQRGDRR